MPPSNIFYVYYTDLNGDLVIARYGLTSANQADSSSEQIILTIGHPTFSNHNGGQLAFGPKDGFLYMGIGDGGSGGDPDGNGQNKNVLLGKLLRLDVETSNPTTYTIPLSNPFTQTVNHKAEIWAYGVRNPWRISFDRQTGDLYMGDVGQNIYEEIDFQAAGSQGGENYGWKIMEGLHCFQSIGCNQSGLTLPVAEYHHNEGCSVTGGFVYRGPSYPRMQGVYFYADYCNGRLWGLKRNGAIWDNTLLVDTPYQVSTFGEDEAGNLYLTSYSTGEIYQLTDPALSFDLSTKQVTPAYGDPGQTFNFTISLTNRGNPLTQTTYLTDTLPTGLAYVPNTLSATFGSVNDSGPNLLWNGLLNPTSTVQITYQVTATGIVTGFLKNVAMIDNPTLGKVTLTQGVIISPELSYLPLILK